MGLIRYLLKCATPGRDWTRNTHLTCLSPFIRLRQRGLASACQSAARSSKPMAVGFRRQRTHPVARCSLFLCRSTNRPRKIRALDWHSDGLAGHARARTGPKRSLIMTEERALVFVLDDDPSMG